MCAQTFSPDGKTLAVLDKNGHVRCWDVSMPQPVDRGLLGGRDKRLGGAWFRIKDQAMVVFAPDGKSLAASTVDGGIRLWDMTPNSPAGHAVLSPHDGTAVQSQWPGTGPLAFSPDGQTLFSGGADHLVRAWNVTGDEPQEKLQPDGPIGGLRAVAFSPDGTRLAVADTAFVRIWNLTDKDELAHRASPRIKIAASVQAVAYSPDGKTLVCGNSIWDVTGDEPVKGNRLPIPPEAEFRSLAFALDGQTLASSGDDQKVRIWDLRGVQPKKWLVIDGSDHAYSVATISRSTNWPVADRRTRSNSGSLPGSNRTSAPVLEGRGPVWSLTFSRDGKTLAAGSAEGLSCGMSPARSLVHCIPPGTSSDYRPLAPSTNARVCPWRSRPMGRS